MSDPVTLSTGAMLLRVALALALVLGLFAAVLFLYRRASRGGTRPSEAEKIELVAQRSLGARSSVALVRVGGEAFLIGVTPQQITRLGAPGRAVRAERGRAQAAQDSTRGAALGLGARAQTPPEAEAPDASFALSLDGELSRLCRRLSDGATPATDRRARARLEV